MLVGLERYLKNAIAQRVSIQRLYGYDGFVIVGHGNETETFAFIRLQIANHFNVLDGPERSKKLPQDIFFRLWCQIIHKNTPSGTIEGTTGQQWIAQ